MKVLFLLNIIVCADDPKFQKLVEKAKPFSTDIAIALEQLNNRATTFFTELPSMFKDNIEQNAKSQIFNDFKDDILNTQSFVTKFGEYSQNMVETAGEIDSFGDPKTMDIATKQQLQEIVRKLGNQISELEKLFAEAQTTDLSARAVEIFKDKYANNFKPLTITKVEEYDKCVKNFNSVFKKYLKEGEKPIIELYKYLYNKATVDAGISMSTTTKWILFSVVG